MKEDITGNEMCELISKFFKSQGIDKTWQEIWEFSPSGELYYLFEWYELAKEWERSLS